MTVNCISLRNLLIMTFRPVFVVIPNSCFHTQTQTNQSAINSMCEHIYDVSGHDDERNDLCRAISATFPYDSVEHFTFTDLICLHSSLCKPALWCSFVWKSFAENVLHIDLVLIDGASMVGGGGEEVWSRLST